MPNTVSEESTGQSLLAASQPSDQTDQSNQIDQSSQESASEVPVKRKRGRPRKSEEQKAADAAARKAAKEAAKAKELEEKEAAGDGDLQTEPEAPVKRKRGRPRKSEEQKAADAAARKAAKEAAKAKELEEKEAAEEGDLQTDPEVPIKRKRGRPRKVKVEEVQLEPVSSQQLEAESKEMEASDSIHDEAILKEEPALTAFEAERPEEPLELEPALETELEKETEAWPSSSYGSTSTAFREEEREEKEPENVSESEQTEQEPVEKPERGARFHRYNNKSERTSKFLNENKRAENRGFKERNKEKDYSERECRSQNRFQKENKAEENKWDREREGQRERERRERNEKPQKYEEGEKARRYDVRRDRNEKSMRVEGVLEILNDGYGFLRGENYLSSRNDIFVSASRIKSLRLRTGDQIVGLLSDKIEDNKARQIEQVETINGYTVHDSMRRKVFERMTPIYPTEKIKMETEPENIGGRMIDLLSPIGKGQRGLIISPPKAGKTTLLKSIARSIQLNNPDIHLIILLIDERPEEVTDFKDFVIDHNVEVVYSTFDEEPEHHRRVAEMAIERAKAIVQHGDDVVILLDSITRLARTYNLLAPNSGKILSGGLDPTSLYYPKHFFGAARNTREGGSLTILATALVDTGSRMDEVIFEEFKGTGNMELVLSRDMAQKRIFPAIDVIKSGTRKEELLLDQPELNAAEMIRNHAVPLKEHANEDIIKNMKVAQDNDTLVQLLNQSKPVSQA